MLWLYSVLFFTVFWFYYKRRKARELLPPGPWSFPLIGSMLSVFRADSKRPSIAFLKLGEKYGPIISLQVGSTYVVVVNGHEELTKMLPATEMMARTNEHDFWLLEKSYSLPLGVIFSNNEFWAHTRQATDRLFRKYGFNSKGRTEQIVAEEMSDFCSDLIAKMTNDQSKVCITDQFGGLFFNIIWILLTGKKYHVNDKGMQKMLEALDGYCRSGQYASGVATAFPKLLLKFPNATGFTAFKRNCADWRNSLSEAINAILCEKNDTEEPQNFVEEFHASIKDSQKPDNILDSIYTDENLLTIVQDLTLAGTDTQARVIKFLLRYLIQRPDIQRRILDEVHQIVGETNTVTVDNLQRLTFTNAVLCEIYRITSVADVAPRKLHTDYKFGSYVLPKGTLILLNFLGANTDSRVWSNPSEFNPNRFLSSEGKLVNTEKMLAFGFGKRRCLGEQVSKTVLTLMTATLVQNFEFDVDPEFGMPSTEILHNFLRDTPPFHIVIRKRR